MEDIVVELVTGADLEVNVKAQRVAQVATAAANIVIGGVTYLRTSPLRTTKPHGGMSIELPLVANGDHWQPAVDSRPSVGGNTLMAIYSQSGT